MIPEELTHVVDLENLIWACDEESIDEIKSLIQTVNNMYYVQRIINHISNFRIFSFKFLGDAMAETGELLIPNINMEFANYLYQRGVYDEESFNRVGQKIQKKEKPLSEYEYPIEENSLWDYIVHDDVNMFVSTIETHDINIDTIKVDVNMHYFTVKCFVLFCGAVNILNYLTLKGNPVSQIAYYYAVEGGQEEMLEHISSKGYSFKNEFETAMLYHQKNVEEWLMDEADLEKVKLAKCIFFMDMDVFFTLLESGRDINEVDGMERTCLMNAVSHNNIPLVKYIISKGATIDNKDYEGQTALDMAPTEEMKQILLNNK